MFQQDLLKNKRILITGGGTGLGRAMAERFVVATLRRVEDHIAVQFARFHSTGIENPRAHLDRFDVRRRDSAEIPGLACIGGALFRHVQNSAARRQRRRGPWSGLSARYSWRQTSHRSTCTRTGWRPASIGACAHNQYATRQTSDNYALCKNHRESHCTLPRALRPISLCQRDASRAPGEDRANWARNGSRDKGQ